MGVAAVHYFYMREYWVILHNSPILYAVNPNVGGGMFWRLLLGTIAMLAFGYAGETSALAPTFAFILGLCGWFFILAEIFIVATARGLPKGDGNTNKHVRSSFNTMRF